MSVNQPPPIPDDEIGNSVLATKRPSVSDKGSIDQRLKRLKEEVLPFYPFLLTVPTDVPFRLGSRFVNNWAVGADGPFAPEEQQLQYMTFLTHHEGDSLLVAVGDWSDETGNIMGDQRSAPKSTASTPTGGSIKKKISLSDYKRKRSGSLASPSTSLAANRSMSTSQVPDDNQQLSKTTSTENSVQRHPSAPLSSKSTSRPAPESTARKRAPGPEHEQSRPREAKHSEIRSPKRPRLSPERAVCCDTDPKNSSNGLPALLSPTLPPTTIGRGLPRLLSPTLPPNIEKELARLREESPLRGSSQKRSNPSTSTISKGDMTKFKSSGRSKAQLNSSSLSSPSVHSKPRNAADKDPNLNSDGGDLSERPTTKLHSHTVDKLPQPSNTTRRTYKSLLSPKADRHASSGRLQLVVKLRYGRPNSKRVEALLKFSGRRKTFAEVSPSKYSSNQEVHRSKEEERIQKDPGPDHLASVSNRPEKRARRDEMTGSVRERSKDLKNSASSVEPKTPVSQPSTSTSVQRQQGKAERMSITPVKDHKSLRRVESDDRKTPPPSWQAIKSTPGDSEAATKLSPRPSEEGTRSRNSERRAWRDEFQKYGNLGRELKHAAERHTAKNGVTTADKKFAAVTAIEAILCFILAFVADDQAKSLARQVGESSTWLSILAYWRVVKKNCSPYPPLHSLCLLLGAVSYDAIHALDLERLAIISLPGDHTPVPTPGSDENAVMPDESKRSRKEFFELKTRLPECYKESQRLWVEGTRGLSEDILTRELPVTWSKRSQSYSEWGNQQLKVGQFSGEYFLPLGRTTTPVEVVRLGWSILNEWCAKEGVDWNGRLGL